MKFISLFRRFALPAILLPFLAFMSSCSDDDLDVPPIGGGDGSPAVVKFILNGNTPDSENAPATYALGKTEEEKVSEVAILLFSINNSLDNAEPIIGTITTGGSGVIHVEANIPVKYYGSIVLLANSSSILSSVTLTEGMQYATVMSLLELKLDDKWNTATGHQDYMSIPMHGETGFIKIEADVTNEFNIVLTRMLSRVDVALSTDIAKATFELTSIAVYHRNTVGRLLQPKIAGVPNLPESTSKLKGPIRYDGTEITNENVSSMGEIYLLESLIANKTNDLERAENATCLVVGGKYLPDGNTYYYRIDFALKDAAPTGFPLHFYNLLRNYHYQVNINAVNGPGEGNEEEALNTERSLIDVEVIPWGNGGAIDGAIDGQYVLRLSQGSFSLPFLKHTATSVNNKLTVQSTHPEGWSIKKITDENEVELQAPAWLTTELPLGEVQKASKTFSLLLTENAANAIRVGYIFIESGPRMQYKLKVTQGAVAYRINKIKWDDYLGYDFRTITIEDNLGNIYTSAVDNSGNLVNASGDPHTINIVGNAISKVTPIYKDYVLDVPPTKYSINSGLETLNITDRTLIGEPIHLDKVRSDLTWSYIQVEDINLKDYTNWVPIGVNKTDPFTGSYDGGSGNRGAGFTISNLKIDMSTAFAGLFGYVSGSTVSLKKIHIASGNISGTSDVGSICGHLESGTIELCTNLAPVKGTGNNVGGIIGLNDKGTVDNSMNSAIINGVTNIGGICGVNTLGVVKNSDNKGAVVGTGNQVGGINGSNTGTIESCKNSSEITGIINVGGICGLNETGTVTSCTNTSGYAVRGTTNVGGISGSSYKTLSLCNNYATIFGSDNVGGICGSNSNVLAADILNCQNFESGKVEGDNQIGGIVGYTGKGTIFKNTNYATVTSIGANSRSTGGIVGENAGGSISTCINKAIISGITATGVIDQYIGGICGLNQDGKLFECTNEGSVTGVKNAVGGISGSSQGTLAEVIDCNNSATAAILGSALDVGGVSGRVGSNGAPIKEFSGNTNAATVTGMERNVAGMGNNIGGIFGSSGSHIVSCTNSGAVIGISNVGGIGGYSGNTIASCNNSGTVTGLTRNGGIIGYSANDTGATIIGAIISHCNNTGNLFGKEVLNNDVYKYIGGICGYIDENSTITKCDNKGNISTAHGSSNGLGGIVGLNKKNKIESCTNSGIITGGQDIGGIAGYNYEGATIIKCENSGAITGKVAVSLVGGICGSNMSSTISSCSNTGEINGYSRLGGISGSHSNAGLITSCTNKAKITGAGDDIGGICGYADISGTIIENCDNLLGADVTGVSSVGGIVGHNSVLPNPLITTVRACINAATITGNSHIGGICGESLSNLYACYNIGSVIGVTRVGPIWGYRGLSSPEAPSLKYCYYGGAAENTSNTNNDGTKFGGANNGGSWPDAGLAGWGTPPWSDLGGWNNGTMTVFPKLAKPAVTPAPPAPYRR